MSAGRVPGPPVGKVLISFVALVAGAGAFAADWNETHIHNPRWTSHAKFHNAQTMLSGATLSAISLWQLWAARGDRQSSLNWGTLFAALYWLQQAPAILFPGTALAAPALADRAPPRRPGPRPPRTRPPLVLHPLLVLGYTLERRRLAGPRALRR